MATAYDIPLSDLFLAYRKVKAELWHMRGIPCALELLEFEERLIENLSTLRRLLLSPDFEPNSAFLGDVYDLPKKILPAVSTETRAGPHFCSLVDKAPKPAKGDTIEHRRIAVPSIAFQILGVLWVMHDGATYDAKRRKSCRANVIRRSFGADVAEADDDSPFAAPGPVNREFPGVFRPYFRDYQRWRADGLAKARAAIDCDQRVYAVTLDLRRFYHQIDAKCLRGLFPPRDLISEHFYKCLEVWQSTHGDPDSSNESRRLGIPVGLIASGVVANLVLMNLDAAIEKRLSPLYYGRYVDDLFLVLSLPGEFLNGAAVLAEIARLLPGNQEGEPRLRWEGGGEAGKLVFECPDAWRRSRFESKADKQKIFELEGARGKALLTVIEQATFEHSSEWRMVPDLDEDVDGWLSETMVVSRDATEEPNTLRKADSLSMRRLGVSVTLRKLEAIERFELDPAEWEKHRRAFYQIIENHVLTPTGLCEFWPNLPRVFGLTFAQGDWASAYGFAKRIYSAIRYQNRISPADRLSTGRQRRGSTFSAWLARVVLQEFSKSRASSSDQKQATSFLSRFGSLFPSNLGGENEPPMDLYTRLLDRDLARTSHRQQIRRSVGRSTVSSRLPFRAKDIDQMGAVLRGIVLQEEDPALLDTARFASIRRLCLPTRLLSEIDICLLTRNQQVDLAAVRRYVSISRGYIWGQESSFVANAGSAPTASALGAPRVVALPAEYSDHATRIAVTNYRTPEARWKARVSGKPDLSFSRLNELLSLVGDFLRAIRKLPFREKPLYFCLPELSVPSEWLIPISAYLSNARVSAIIGAEYETAGKRRLANPAYLFLRTAGLGYPTTLLFRRCKTRPAAGEASLLNQYGVSLKGGNPADVPVYRHGNFQFGVLLCSELIDAEFQYHFRSHVDAVFCLEWNPDTDSFASLVETAAQTVHAFIVQVNNREYGDSRIRSPAKETYKRDVVQLRGGDHDYFVIGTLPVQLLRAYQMCACPDLGRHAAFKPTPPGFDHRNPRLKGSS